MHKEILKTKMPNVEYSIVLYDGECGFCDRFVHFVIERDPHSQFHFAPLQSKPARAMLKNHGILLQTDLNTIYLIQNGIVHTKSTAALRIAQQLDSVWSFLHVFLLVPRSVRDIVYTLVGKYRHRWFLKRNTCGIITPELEKRFIHEYVETKRE